MSYEKELTAAKKAVSLAARLSQEVQKTLLQSEVRKRCDRSPVTAADYGSQAVVSLILERELQPEKLSLVAEEETGDLRKKGSEVFLEGITKLVKDTLASEESYAGSPPSTDDVLNAIDCGKSEGGCSGCHWVLDPIDGTRGFVRGEQYAVGLALLVEGKVVLGVMACPNLPLASAVCVTDKSSQEDVGCLFFATTGSGTYVQPLAGNSPPQKVQVSSNEKRVVTKSYLKGLGINWASVRNVMDMRAVYGGFAAALRELKVWVMNVVPIDSPDTLAIIYERGLFGIYHDWCESFSTYPRSYDLLHADHLFSKLKQRCNLTAVIAEVDRVLRPEGKLIVRDDAETIQEVEAMVKAMKWEVRMTYSKEKEGLLSVQKSFWRPNEVETLTYALA